LRRWLRTTLTMKINVDPAMMNAPTVESMFGKLSPRSSL
jgi:hypothetical protein